MSAGFPMRAVARGRSRNPLWSAYEALVMVVGLGSFALLCIGAIPLFALYRLGLPRRSHRRAVRVTISRGFRGYLRMLGALCAIHSDTRELETLRSAGPLIIIANHPSLLDAVVLISRLPNATCIMKSGLLANPLYGFAARMAGYVSNADAERMLAHSRNELALGSSFVFFPEGGRSREFPVSRFSGACVLLSRLTKTPIQTVFLDFSSPYLGKRWGLFTPPVLPLRIRARLGRRFAPEEMHPAARGELERYFQAEVRLDAQ